MSSDVLYQREQRTRAWALVSGLILTVVLLAMTLGAEADVIGLVITAVVTLVVGVLLAMFSTLRVEVTPSTVAVAFTWGWPRREILRSAIESHAPVRNRWLYGWGLRWIPRGMLWNVWGLDAVELQLSDGRRFRIGTDDPLGLDAALSA